MSIRAHYKKHLPGGLIEVADRYIEEIGKPHFSSDGRGVFQTDEEADAEIDRRVASGALPPLSD